jgi:hypothetical protein
VAYGAFVRAPRRVTCGQSHVRTGRQGR